MKLAYLLIHFWRSSDDRHEMYLLPCGVSTWKQLSWPNTLAWSGLKPCSNSCDDVISMEFIVTELVSRDSWDRDDRMREFMMDLKGNTKRSKAKSTFCRKLDCAGTLRNRLNLLIRFFFGCGILTAFDEDGIMDSNMFILLQKCSKKYLL